MPTGIMFVHSRVCFYNPSVSRANSSLYTREPFLPKIKLIKLQHKGQVVFTKLKFETIGFDVALGWRKPLLLRTVFLLETIGNLSQKTHPCVEKNAKKATEKSVANFLFRMLCK